MSLAGKPETQNTETSMRTLIGVGALDWHRQEEITERFGSIALSMFYPTKIDGLLNHHGKLEAIVRANRENNPRRAQPGEFLSLGEGKLLRESIAGDTQVGLIPDDGRPKNWLSKKSLDRLRGTIVELWFTEC